MAKKRKKNSKILYVLFGILIFFGVFIYIITIPSVLSKALKELEISNTKEEIKSVWDKYKSELASEEDFLLPIRTKLSLICKTESEVENCKEWLPKPPESLNIVVIPDLSNRLTIIPNQKENDIEILNFIWEKFKKQSIPKKQSNDFLSIDLSDNGQLKDFQNIADSLVFNLSKEKKGVESNKKYFDRKGNLFKETVSKLYGMVNRTKGADFVDYFKNHAEKNIKKSDFFTNYRNIFIVLTDGYLETETEPYTANGRLQSLICNDIKGGINLNQSFQKQKIASIASRIPVDIDLTGAEVLILEINERPEGVKCHYDILKKFWQDWFRAMKVKNVETDFFLIHEDATKKTINILDDFINKKTSYIIDDTKERTTEKVVRSSDFTPNSKSKTTNTKLSSVKSLDIQSLSEKYKTDAQSLLKQYSNTIFENIRQNSSTNKISLRKENQEIDFNVFKQKLKNGDFKNRNVYHVGVSIGYKIISIEIE